MAGGARRSAVSQFKFLVHIGSRKSEIMSGSALALIESLSDNVWWIRDRVNYLGLTHRSAIVQQAGDFSKFH